MPFLDCLFVGYWLCWCCTRSWRPIGQWDVHAATHRQGYQRMLLSPSEAASDTKLCQSNSHGTTCDVTHVITRIDYCNSVLAGLPACTLAPLQRVQSAAARLMLNLDRRSHISPALRLHWLPVKYRVTFKIATLISSNSTQPLSIVPCRLSNLQCDRPAATSA